MGKRIEYIDSMRGFTMLLVVFSHIVVLGYHELKGFTLNEVFILFRMPLFFFISGFILYKESNLRDLELFHFMQKKFMIQIIPTFVFFFIYCILFEQQIGKGIYDIFKYGYWFTLALFEFFVFYTLTLIVGRFLKLSNDREHILYLLSLLIVFAIYLLYIKGIVPWSIGAALGFLHLKYYPYFILGLLVRKYFSKFQEMLAHGWIMSSIILLFGLSSYYLLHYNYPLVDIFLPYIPGITGIVIIFAFFRRYSEKVSMETRLGRLFQFVGRRTLDVYLLHYFFVPKNLSCIGNFFSEYPNFLLEFFVSLFIAILVVAVCLICSSILRLSPVYEHYLFGVKKK